MITWRQYRMVCDGDEDRRLANRRRKERRV